MNENISVDADSILTAIMNRRSIRRYTSKPVARDLVKQILTAGIWSPSAHNRQPWRFAIVETEATKQSLAQAMGARLRLDLERDHVDEDIIQNDISRSYSRITSAPVIILVALTLQDMDTYTDDWRNQNEYIMAAQSTAMAGQNILLSAHVLGLGACWMCAPLFCPDIVIKELNLPEDWQPQGMITLGYPAEERVRARQPLETRLLWR